jgi:asparagine synthase (glutamine-hydrolysing)
MSQISGSPVDAYTIAFRAEDARLEQAGGEDARFAELVAREFGANYHRIDVSPDIVSLLPKVIWHLDEPVADPAAITSFLIADAARQRVKVMLSGQGADEIFAGYRVHLSDRLSRLLARFPRFIRAGLLGPALNLAPALARGLPGVHPGLALAVQRYFRKLLAGIDLNPEERYVYNRSYYTQSEALQLYAPDLREHFSTFDGGYRHQSYFDEVADADFVNRMLHVDLHTFLPELNLTYADKTSMAASIETRLPFLDAEIVAFMEQLPTKMKLRGVTTKYLLRKAMGGVLPKEIIRRRKAGFGAPIRRWIEVDLRDMIDDLLSAERVASRGYFDPKAVRSLIDRNRSGQADNTYRIWALLTLELWHQIFIDGTLTPSL